MRVEELSVGDYIKFNGSPYIVEEISGKGWIHILDVDTKARVQLSSDYILDSIDGVPLTPEILKKNGFTYIIVLGEVAPKLENFELDNHWEGDGYSWNDIPLLYVHQLQHALRLCGIEKEIIL